MNFNELGNFEMTDAQTENTVGGTGQIREYDGLVINLPAHERI